MNKEKPQYRPIRKIIATAFVFTLLAGCASSQFERMADAEAIDEIDSIKSVALLQIPEPLKYKFGEGLLGGGAFFFGAIGAVVDLASFENADATSEYYKDNFIFSEEMHRMLVASLQHNNIDVRIVPAPRDKNRRLLNSYDGIVSDADAFLDIVPDAFIGYMSDSGMFDPDFYPVLTASVRLVSARSKKVLFEDRFYYGGDPNPFIKQIEAPEEHVYETKKGLQENKTEAVGHLITGVNVLGSEILRSLSVTWEMPEPSPVKQASINVEKKPASTVRKENPNESKSLVEQATDISGTYTSRITGLSQSYMRKQNKKAVTIKQNGNKITGTFGSGGQIEGTIENDTIVFDWYGTYAKGNGKWKIQDNGKGMIGSWRNIGGGRDGKWDLLRTDSTTIALINTSNTNSNSEDQPAPYLDLSGTYISDITTNNNWRFRKAEDRRLKITISQNGNEITGTNKSKNLKISGVLEGDEISFFTWPSDISSDEIKGKWRINSDGTRLTGKWSHPHGGGKWNLTRVK